jgi:subtilisin family serine protease
MRGAFIAVAVLCATASLHAAGKSDDRADRILVKPKLDVPAHRIAAEHAAEHARVHRQYPRFGGWQVITLPAGLGVEEALEKYRQSGLFESVEPDYEVQPFATPNDPYFTDGTLYGLSKISAPAAWDIRSNAASVIVAVIDSGIRDTHQDLAGNLWVNPGEIPGNGLDDDGDGVIDDVHGFDATAPTNSPAAGNPVDSFGHGTHVAGTIGATGNNGIGSVGVAWRVRLMACKFINVFSGQLSDAIECMDFALAHGARVINASWGCEGCNSQALRDAIIAAGKAGAVFVAAAGNNGANLDETPFYPAAYDLDNVVAVAATDRDDQLAGFSNFGRQNVALAAPGVDVLSTYAFGDAEYRSLNGTSMAAPHVAGAMALLTAQFPKATPAELVARLLGTTDPLPALAGKCLTGGRLNLFKALTAKPAPVARFTMNPPGGEPPLTVTFSNRSLNASTFLWDYGDGSRQDRGRTATHRFANVGTYTVTLTARGPNGAFSTVSQPVTVAPNYRLLPGNFFWVNPSGMTALVLSDDSAAGAMPLPFPFTLYGQTYSNLYVGSNGLLGFRESGMSVQFPTPLPNPYAPNAVLYPLWSDLDPSAGGSVRIGTVGAAPDRVVVVSWVGVPHWADQDGSFTFQALLYETRNDIVFQYLDANPGNPTNGAGRTATIGIENPNGAMAREFSSNGRVPLTNGQALAFTMSNVAPPAPPPPVPGTPHLTLLIARTAERVDLGWAPVVGADGYVVLRNGAPVASTTNTLYSDVGLSPDTEYCYAVLATNRAGHSPPSANECATTLSAPSFVMDGSADFAGYLQRADGLTLYVALRGQTLYVATQSPGANAATDRLILVATWLEPTAYLPPPLEKAGRSASDSCEPVLLGDASGQARWDICGLSPDDVPQFPAEMSATTEGVLEATLDLRSLYGYLPETLYLAAVDYTPGPGGALVAQTPPGNGDGNLDPNEFLKLPVVAVVDGNRDGVYDRLDPQLGFAIAGVRRTPANGFEIVWNCVPDQRYQVQSTESLASGPWFDLGPQQTAPALAVTMSYTDSAPGTQRFYRVKLVP